MNGGGTRTKIDLFPEYIRHLPQDKKPVWEIAGQALCSKEVREAFRKQLAPGLQQRFRRGLHPRWHVPDSHLNQGRARLQNRHPSGHALERDDYPALSAAGPLH